MISGRPFHALCIASVLAVTGAASAAAAGHHKDQSGGIRNGHQGQVFGSQTNSAAPKVYGLANSGTVRDPAAPYTAGHAAAVLDSLTEQYKDKNWDHRYQSWCDVDPNCNGWNKKMQEYEAIEQRIPHL